MPSPIIRYSQVSFCYPTRIAPTLSDITLDIDPGDFVLVSGPTGCGKTTFLKMLNGIIPHLSKGRIEGTLTVAGKNTAASSMEDLTNEVGIVFQCPDDQIVSNTVEEEIAFGLENMGLGADAISEAIASALDRMGIGDLKYRDTKTLSGGQKQRTVIASQIALHPKILALDEPLSQLDPRGAREVMQCIVDLNRQGVTIVMVEHRIAEAARYANKVLLMESGHNVHYGDMRKSFSTASSLYRRLGIQLPEEVILSFGFGMPEATFAVDTLKSEISRMLPIAKGRPKQAPDSKPERKRHLTLQDIHFGYDTDRPLFSNLNLTFHSGEFVALMGANGAGKSTLLSLIAGLRKPHRGRILSHESQRDGNSNGSAKVAAGILLQNPDLMLFCESVEKEMLFGPEHRGAKHREAMARVDFMLDRLQLDANRKDAPFSLSVGQRLRTALGSILTMRAPILLLDEPTTGQNQENIIRIMGTLRSLKFIRSIIFCTHDVQTAMQYAERVILLQTGKVVYDGSPAHVFDNIELAEACGLAMPASMILARGCGIKEFSAGAAGLLHLLGKGDHR